MGADAEVIEPPELALRHAIERTVKVLVISPAFQSDEDESWAQVFLNADQSRALSEHITVSATLKVLERIGIR